MPALFGLPREPVQDIEGDLTVGGTVLPSSASSESSSSRSIPYYLRQTTTPEIPPTKEPPSTLPLANNDDTPKAPATVSIEAIPTIPPAPSGSGTLPPATGADDHDGLSAGLVITIAVGFCALVLLALVGWCLWSRKKEKKKKDRLRKGKEAVSVNSSVEGVALETMPGGLGGMERGVRVPERVFELGGRERGGGGGFEDAKGRGDGKRGEEWKEGAREGDYELRVPR
ncbi:hypothetical protein BJ508DRAFT_329489 [Ascobolus immersus RN42]|uniref:Uncharacterized protein n=1 Tax=Ascobolus immersus RN42 TaxID=1160509 RepID=A0A3N4I292_ASCIM|nr:hypothetical protein BJ508DRAFT_329489 [Ascobolus immersus RN42]